MRKKRKQNTHNIFNNLTFFFCCCCPIVWLFCCSKLIELFCFSIFHKVFVQKKQTNKQWNNHFYFDLSYLHHNFRSSSKATKFMCRTCLAIVAMNATQIPMSNQIKKKKQKKSKKKSVQTNLCTLHNQNQKNKNAILFEKRFSYLQRNWRKSVKNTSTECMYVRAKNGI